MKRTEKDDAVSPVVGVMLMLVVTIIIAAVVAAFAGGIATETKATPNAIIAVDEHVLTKYGGSYDDEFGNPVYYTSYDLTNMTLSNRGGETLSTNELSLVLERNLASKTYQFGELMEFAKSFGPGDSVELHKDEVFGIVDQSVDDGDVIKWHVIYTPNGQAISSGSFVVSYSNDKIIDKTP